MMLDMGGLPPLARAVTVIHRKSHMIMPASWTPRPIALPFDKAAADRAVEEWAAASSSLPAEGESARALIAALAGNSPHLARLLRRMPAYFGEIVAEGPDVVRDRLFAACEAQWPAITSESELMRALREAKAKVALLTAAADVGGAWDLEAVTACLTHFADLSVRHALNFLLRQAAERGELDLPDPRDDPGRGAGIFILGLGKLGGGELNYSSDIDIVALYDEERIAYRGRHSPQEWAVATTRRLVRILEQHTADGYVWRVDLRLRPDPGATPIALSVGAAETYYQSLALNWERAAMIKARPIAGDREAADSYLDLLKPFVWRRSLDFAAIEDIHAIRNQIVRHYEQQGRRLAGFDVKLGEGGIREIEFFVQIQQLIHGGRDPRLRERATLAALQRLVETGRTDATVAAEMEAAYRFLRLLEHRLQMVEDRQTHRLPESEEGLRHIAFFAGFGHEPDPVAALAATLGRHTARVTHHYDHFLPPLGRSAQIDEQALLALFRSLGGTEEESESFRRILENWRRGRYRALRSDRARRILARLLPELMRAFAGFGDIMHALARFDAFLKALPAGVSFLSLLESNRPFLDLIARILTISPLLADLLARHPSRIDALLDPDFFVPVSEGEDWQHQIRDRLAEAREYEEALDLARILAAETRFRIGVQLLEGLISPAQAAAALTRLADTLITSLFPAVEREYARRYGRFPAGELLVLALGKYGGEELGFGSDLDIVLLYRSADRHAESTGPRRVGASRYFSGLGQNLLTALSVPTAEGPLFEVDTRLRPSGRAGPLVVSLATFRDYHEHAAWTFEHMALTRARVVVGSPQGRREVADVVSAILARPRPAETVLRAVADMRERIRAEFPGRSALDIKYARGGIVDVEFIVQYLLLKEIPVHGRQAFGHHLADAIAGLARIGSLTAEEAAILADAHRFFLAVQMWLRLTAGPEIPDPETLAPETASWMARRLDFPDFAAVMAALEEKRVAVEELYTRIIAAPAAKLTG